MISLTHEFTQNIENDGFVIFNNVLSKSEITKLRKIVNNHFQNKGVSAHSGMTQPNAAIDVPEISWLFYHPKIIAIMRQLFRQEDIMFTSHCDVHCRTLSGWHKDDGMTV